MYWSMKCCIAGGMTITDRPTWLTIGNSGKRIIKMCNGNCDQGRRCDCLTSDVFDGLITLGFAAAMLAAGGVIGFLVGFLVGE